MAVTNISKAGKNIKIDITGQSAKYANPEVISYGFSESLTDTLLFKVDRKEHRIPLADLRVNGVVQATQAAALTAIEAVFTDSTILAAGTVVKVTAANAEQVSLKSSEAEAIDITTVDHTLSSASRGGLYVGGAGVVIVRMLTSQTNVTFSGVTAGAILPIIIDKVIRTGTTATLMVALK